jgi:uncharacterized protein (DUF427 family)
MGLSGQQGPLSPGAIGHFLMPQPLPKTLLYVEPLRRRMRVRFGGKWIADSEDVLLLFEPARYPVAYFPETDIDRDTLQPSQHTTRHHDLGPTSWYTVRVGEQNAPRGAWKYIDPPAYASQLQGGVRLAGHGGFLRRGRTNLGPCRRQLPSHRYPPDLRSLVVRHADRVIADTRRPMVLYESGFAPRWYVPRADVDESALTPVEHQTFCPYKGLCSYYDVGDARLAAWSYPRAYPEVGRISDLVSFEPDNVSVQLDGKQLRLEPGQTVIPHGPDRDLTMSEVLAGGKSA